MGHVLADSMAPPEREDWKKIARVLNIWQKFKDIRESLKDKGVSGSSAWLAAARQLGWVHHDRPKHGHMRGDACEFCEQFGEGDQDSGSPGEEESSPAVNVERGSIVSGSYVNRDIVLMPKSMALEKPRQDVSADIEWVVENYAVAGVTPEDAPTARSWSLYSMAKVSQRGFEMVLQHHQRMMPTGKQLEAESGRGELGEKKLAEFESYLDSNEHVGILGADSLQLQGTENASSERVVSEKDVASRG